MHYLISGLAKSGTTRLFSQLEAALKPVDPGLQTFFEPDTEDTLAAILARSEFTLTKVLVGRVTTAHRAIAQFDRHMLIYRDPRDQFISMLLYLFYDFQLSGDREGFQQARDALADKVRDPESVSTIELYNLLAGLVGRGPVKVFSRLHEVQRSYREAFKPFPVRYEALLAGDAIADLEAYLGLQLESDAQVAQEYSRVVRSKGYGEWRRWLNKADLEFIDREWGDTLAELGYERTTHPGALEIDPRISLEYVAQFSPE